MGRPAVLQKNFSLGMRQDSPRESMMDGSVWSMVDWIPDQAYPLQKRGGYTYNNNSLSTTLPFTAMAVAPFVAGAKLCGVNNARLYSSAINTAALTNVDAWGVGDVLTFHRDLLVGWTHASAPNTYDGSTVGTIATAPTARSASVYRDRTWAGYTSADPTRLWWSDAGDPTTWDTAEPDGSWVDTEHEIVGLGSPGGQVLLVFHPEKTSRVRGSPGVDMVLEGLYDVGLNDKRSIATWRAYSIWADVRGVYISDGISMVDLAKAGGMTLPYRDSTQAYAQASGVVWKDHYILSLHNGSNAGATYVIDLATRRWWQFSNLACSVMCSYGGGTTGGTYIDSERVFAGKTTGGAAVVDRIVRLDPMFTDDDDEDADGTDILPVLETPYYEVIPGSGPGRELMRWTQFYLNYATDTGGILLVTPSTDPISSSAATALTTYTASTPVDRHPRRLGYLSRGMRFRIEQTAKSNWTRIYDIEAEVFVVEGNR